MPKQFYAILDNGDGTVDVYMDALVTPRTTEDGITDYDIQVHVVKGVVPWDGLEDSIRNNYYAWRDLSQIVEL